jgi:uncharacterized protein (TIGR01777 family)
MAEARRVVITGATGLIGRALCRELIGRGYQVTIFSRSPEAARARVPDAAAYVQWAPGPPGAWAAYLDGAYGIVNLAGASIAGQRWSPAYKREILESREQGARGLVDAMAGVQVRPRVLVSASGVDYYGDRGETTVDEQAPPGTSFLPQVCVVWEREALRAEEFGVRTAVFRIGIVLDKEEGALAKLLPPFQFGVGGPILPGTQWWSWIHRDDVVGLMLAALEDERMRGPFNATAPEPARNRDFAATLGRVMGRPSWAPVPTFALQLLIGEMARPLLIEKQRALPARALELGYRFCYPQLELALRSIFLR